MKIGIITIHKMNNFGSALQAFALQRFLKISGYDSKLIDYHWTWEEYNPSFLMSCFLKLKFYAKLIIKHNSSFARFAMFHNRYFELTNREYTKHNIDKHPPVFDLYITGSDQVWNCRFTDGDPNFLLRFAPPTSKKISYASSFASPSIPDKYKALFCRELSKYDHLLVREMSGVKIIKELTGKDAKVVCDPTLLLSDNDYKPMAEKSRIKIDGPYILVYILGYMFNPYPEVNNIIEKVRAELGGGKIVFLRCYENQSKGKDRIVIENEGPLEFLWLIRNASFVITSSFHGTAFAVINHKPLLAVVQSRESEDGRMQTLLGMLEQKDSLIAYNEIPSSKLINSKSIITKDERLTKLREDSRKTLLDIMRAYG